MSKAIMSCLPCLFTPEEKQHSEKPRARPDLTYEVNWNDFKHTRPGLMRSTFVQSYCDHGTQEYLVATESPSNVKQTASDILSKVVGRTSANGITFRGGMFVFSSAQLAKMLRCVERGIQPEDQVFPQGLGPSLVAASSNTPDSSSSSSAATNSKTKILNRYGLTKSSDNDDDDGEDANAELRRILGKDDDAGDKKNDDDDDERKKERMGKESPAAKARREEDQLVEEYKHKYKVIVDIGAGDGGVTKQMAPFFDDVVVTEDNAVMRQRLKYVYGSNNVISSDMTSSLLLCVPPQADVIALLNVIDRCERPMTLLKEIRQGLLNRMWLRDSDPTFQYGPAAALPPLLILAVVLPWCPFVESGSQQLPPEERLPMEGGGLCREGASFEASLDRFVQMVVEPLGFKLRCWTRLPYLSEGDAQNAYFKLDDALLMLEPCSNAQ